MAQEQRRFIEVYLTKSELNKIVFALDAEFTGVYSDYGLDTDSNGLFDFLVIEAGVSISKSGD